MPAKKKNTPVSQQPAKPTETREQKLQRLGVKRVNAALTKIRLIGNLATYKPTDAQTDKIMQTVGEAMAMVEARLRGVRRSEADFTF